MTANRKSVVGVLLPKVSAFAVMFVGLVAGTKAQADVFNLPSGQTSLRFVVVGAACVISICARFPLAGNRRSKILAR